LNRLKFFRTSVPIERVRTARGAVRIVLPMMLVFGVAVTSLAYVSTSAASAATTTSDCSWGFRSGSNTLNIADPDTSANYWAYNYAAVPGTELIIKGTYPLAR